MRYWYFDWYESKRNDYTKKWSILSWWFTRINNAFVFRKSRDSSYNFSPWIIRNLQPVWNMFLRLFPSNFTEDNHYNIFFISGRLMYLFPVTSTKVIIIINLIFSGFSSILICMLSQGLYHTDVKMTPSYFEIPHHHSCWLQSCWSLLLMQYAIHF